MNHRIFSAIFLIASLIWCKLPAQEIVLTGAKASEKVNGSVMLRYVEGHELPVYVKLEEDKEVPYAEAASWISQTFKTLPGFSYKVISAESNEEQEVNYRCIQTYNNIPVFDATFIIHTYNNNITALNGKLYRSLNCKINTTITENDALQSALKSSGAKRFMWQSASEEAALKEQTENNAATYFPTGELFYLKTKGSSEYKLSWRFDIYAADTLLRQWIFINASSGEVLLKLDRIKNTDTQGTAVTKYSGTQAITTDSYSGTYRLRETGRGNGIRTYNMQKGTSYTSAVDFTDADNYWNNVNAQYDEVATDAHWAAEKYYDYLYNNYNRNSLDNAGFALLSYVHYSTSYANAFWDGQRMTYGDGDATWTPLTACDIAGHEMTHGLTENTANLTYQDESGALNEGFSDIFGTALEYYAKPSSANWLIGEDIGTPIRSLSNPGTYGLPDTYQGQNWYTGTGDNGGVHYNCGVLAYWFYLVSQGGSGTNDNNNTYNITGIGLNKAEKIAYRLLTSYLTSSSEYADARFYSIQAAADLYGSCSQEVETVTNAWYAVGIGTVYSATVDADFSSDMEIFCLAPATVQFTNITSNANSYLWYFGDGSTSTLKNPAHTYSGYGNFDVKLVSYGGSCGNDSIVKTAYISVDQQNPCTYIMPASGNSTLSTCTGILYDIGGTGNYPDNSTSITTIAPPGAIGLTLNFTEFDVEPGSSSSCNYDYLEIYNGTSTSSTLVGKYCNTTGGPGTVSTNGAATIKFYSDQGLNLPGFKMLWSCSMPNLAPITYFTASQVNTCDGAITFSDLSTNGPNQWVWDFGDGNTSTLQNPTHVYTANGDYTVKLVVNNSFGTDSLIKVDYITVNMPVAPVANGGLVCDSGSIVLSATAGYGEIAWYDNLYGGSIIGSGNSYTTPLLTNSTTYYTGVIDTVMNSFFGGKADNSGSGANYNQNYTHYLVFDSSEPVILKSVKVYSSTTGNRTIYLKNSSGTTIDSKTVSIPSGESRVNLNFNVPAGSNLQLAAQTYPNLYRNDGSTAYPYNIGGAVTITGSSASTNPTGYYYYFYDWEVVITDTCLSPRVQVNADVVKLSPSISVQGPVNLCPGDSVILTANNNSVATQYLWSPTGEPTESITVKTPGYYYFQVTDTSGCSAQSDSLSITTNTSAPSASFTYYIADTVVYFVNNTSLALSYLWNFGDSSTSVLSSPTHIYKNDSTYLVTLIAYNGCGTDTITDSVIYTVTGLSDNNNADFLFNVFPNPAKDNKIFVEITNYKDEEFMISIYNMPGEELMKNTFNSYGRKTYSFDLANLSKGVYIIKASSKYATKIHKLILY